MSIVCFDTNVLISAIQDDETDENTLKAKLLIRDCKTRKVNILIPSLVIAEVFMRLDHVDRSSFFSDISRLAIIAPFDVRASFEYGKVSDAKWSRRKEFNISRNEMKFDMLIVATAMANKSECIYSEDAGVIKVADGFIETRKLPGYKQQTAIDLGI